MKERKKERESGGGQKAGNRLLIPPLSYGPRRSYVIAMVANYRVRGRFMGSSRDQCAPLLPLLTRERRNREKKGRREPQHRHRDYSFNDRVQGTRFRSDSRGPWGR